MASAILMVSSLQATVIFSDSFDYGSSDLGFNSGSVGNWSSTSGVLKYDADGGLSTSTVSGSGGSMWLDFNDVRTAGNSDPNLAYSTLGAGDEMWLSYLVDFTAGGAVTSSLELEGGTVSDIHVNITSAGSIVVDATLDTTLNNSNGTGLTLSTGVHHVLLRATKGTGTSPINSQLDLWLNPTDTSSVAGLGAAGWTLDSSDGQVKWGRDTDTFSSITANPNEQGRLDEIRIATTFSELNLVPEPSSALLLGFAGGFALLRRRRVS